jgi:hypothetical protein
LVVFIILILSHNLSVFSIKFGLNGKNLTLLVDEVFTFILPELVPSRVGGVSVSISSSDIDGSVLEGN